MPVTVVAPVKVADCRRHGDRQVGELAWPMVTPPLPVKVVVPLVVKVPFSVQAVPLPVTVMVLPPSLKVPADCVKVPTDMPAPRVDPGDAVELYTNCPAVNDTVLVNVAAVFTVRPPVTDVPTVPIVLRPDVLAAS